MTKETTIDHSYLRIDSKGGVIYDFPNLKNSYVLLEYMRRSQRMKNIAVNMEMKLIDRYESLLTEIDDLLLQLQG